MAVGLVLRSGEVVAREVLWARGRVSRARGLIGRPPLAPGLALVIEGGGGQVHTFGMSYALDVAFCDEHWVVVHVTRGLPPRRITRWVRGCRYVVELRAGSLPRSVKVGAELLMRRLAPDT